MVFNVSIFKMGLHYILDRINNCFDRIRLIIQIIWEIHVHYLRLYKTPTLIDKYFDAWKLIHYPDKCIKSPNDMRFRTITLGKLKRF